MGLSAASARQWLTEAADAARSTVTDTPDGRIVLAGRWQVAVAGKWSRSVWEACEAAAAEHGLEPLLLVGSGDNIYRYGAVVARPPDEDGRARGPIRRYGDAASGWLVAAAQDAEAARA